MMQKLDSTPLPLLHHDALTPPLPNTMSSSRHQSPSKRLLSELRNYASDPNPALERLGPVSDDDLLHWTAVMRGAPGTPYEGMCPALVGHTLTENRD